LQDEVDAARRAVAEGEDPDTLAKRFASIDSQIQAIQNDINSLSSNKVNISDIVNNLTSNNTNKPLSANMGKALRDLVGGVYDENNTVTDAIDAAEASAKAYTDEKNTYYNVAEINAAHRNLGIDPETEEVIVDSLNKRFRDAEEDITALQTEVTTAHADNASLNTRLTTLESDATAIAADLHTIATELAMLDD